jgi:xanthine dehydrogenase accessory factor
MASDAKMLVRPDGYRAGTIGGGCLEADVTAQALDALRSGQPAMVRHTLNADVAGDLGLSCGGTVELLVEPVIPGPAAAGLYGAVADAIAGRESGVVITDLDWSAGPRKAARAGARTLCVGTWDDPDLTALDRPRPPSTAFDRP